MHVGTQVQVSESKKIIAAVGCWMDDFCVWLRVTGLHCERGCWLATKVMLSNTGPAMGAVSRPGV